MRALRHLSFGFAILGALAAAATIAPTRSGYAYDYIQNGGFEDGVDGWTLVSSGSTLDAEPDVIAPYSGSGRGRITLAQSSFTLLQTTSMGVPAGDYRFSVRIRSDSSTLVMHALVAGGSPVTTYWREVGSNVIGEWWSFTATVHVTGFDIVTFRVGGTAATGDVIYVDDMQFEGAPPATMTPTDTPLPPTATDTPLPPTATKTPKPTSTPAPEATGETPTDAEGSLVALADGGLFNGGFEEVDAEGVPVSWSKYGGALISDTTAVHGGARAARLKSSTESTKWAFQTVRVQGGAAYAFDAWLRPGAGLGGAWLRVSWYASADGSGEAMDTADSTSQLDLATPEWQPLTTGSIVAPAGALSAKLRVMLQPSSAAHASVSFDDASFGPTAPPLPEGAAEAEGAPEAAGPQAAGSASQAAARGEGSNARRDRAANGPRPAPGTQRVVINEVLYDGMNVDGSDTEWVELFNAGDTPIALDGWYLADGSSADMLTDLVIPARGFALVAGQSSVEALDGTTVPVAVVEGHIGNSLGNEGDVLLLVDPAGRFVDAVSWGANTAAMRPAVASVPAGHSIERRTPGADTDLAEDFVDNERPSPGGRYGGAAAGFQPVTEAPAQVLSGQGGLRFDWLPWALASAAGGALAAVGAARAWPAVAGRLRHP